MGLEEPKTVLLALASFTVGCGLYLVVRDRFSKPTRVAAGIILLLVGLLLANSVFLGSQDPTPLPLATTFVLTGLGITLVVGVRLLSELAAMLLGGGIGVLLGFLLGFGLAHVTGGSLGLVALPILWLLMVVGGLVGAVVGSVAMSGLFTKIEHYYSRAA